MYSGALNRCTSTEFRNADLFRSANDADQIKSDAFQYVFWRVLFHGSALVWFGVINQDQREKRNGHEQDENMFIVCDQRNYRRSDTKKQNYY